MSEAGRQPKGRPSGGASRNPSRSVLSMRARELEIRRRSGTGGEEKNRTRTGKLTRKRRTAG